MSSLVLAALAAEALLRRPDDWETTYLPAGRWLIQGRDFYDLHATGFGYPPAAALLAAAFVWLPPNIERGVWVSVNLIAVGAFWWCAWRASSGCDLSWADEREQAELAQRIEVVFR